MGRLPFVAGVRNRRARIKARRGIKLRDVGIAPKTQERYYTAVSQLLKVLPAECDYESMDLHISDWIEEQFEKGSPLNIVADGLSGMHYFLPSTRKKLPCSWKLFGIWRKIEIPSRAPPLTEELFWAFTGKLLGAGAFSMAAVLALGFHCMLRTGELLAVRPKDILLRGQQGIVSLPSSKGGTRHNIQESVTILDSKLVTLFHELINLKRAQGLINVPIWTGSGSAFRTEFQLLTRYFHVEHHGFRGYSLRRGGATAFFRQTGLMEQTLLRGRWASVAVARLYLCDALSQIPGLTASSRTRKLIAFHRAFWSTSSQSSCSSRGTWKKC